MRGILTENTVRYRLRLEDAGVVAAGVERGRRRAVRGAGRARQRAAGRLAVARAVVRAVEGKLADVAHAYRYKQT